METIYMLVGALIGVGGTHVYYRKSKADFAALQVRFDALQGAVQLAIDQGIVSMERSPTGQITDLKPPRSS